MISGAGELAKTLHFKRQTVPLVQVETVHRSLWWAWTDFYPACSKDPSQILGIGEILISCNSHLDRFRWSNTQFSRALGRPPRPQPATLTHEHWRAAKKMFFFVCVWNFRSFRNNYKKSVILGSGKSYINPIFLHELAGYFQKPNKNGRFRRMVSPVPAVWGEDLRTVSCWEQPGVGTGTGFRVTPLNWPMRENDVKSMG